MNSVGKIFNISLLIALIVASCLSSCKKEIEVTDIKLVPTTKTLLVGENFTIVAAIEPTTATNKSVKWQSSTLDIATVDATGKVTAKKAGKATITATTVDGAKTATCLLTVSDTVVSVTGIKLEPTTKTLLVGEEFLIVATIEPSTANNQAVKWQSSASDIASVDSVGKVIAKKVGRTTITATTVDGAKTATCLITVSETVINVTGVKVEPTTKTLLEGEEFTIKAVIEPSTANNKSVRWQSSRSDIATVDATGKVTAKKAGQATITATTVDGAKSATCVVTVEENIPLITKKSVIIEEFTAHWCKYCYPALNHLHDIMRNYNDRVILVCHHVRGDNFVIAASDTLYQTYGVKGIPSCMVDRTKSVYGSSIVFPPLNLKSSAIDKQLAMPATVHLGAKTSYNENTKEIKIEIVGNLLQSYPKARLNVYLLQDGIISPQSGGGGNNYIHNNALRAVLSTSGLWGDRLGVSIGRFSKTYTYRMPDKIGKFATDISKMYIVAFITEYHSNSSADLPKNIVHNVIKKKIK